MNRALGPLLALLCLACGDATGLLVEVTSPDLTVPGDIDTLRFQVTSDAGHSTDVTYAVDGAWPHSLTIAPAGSADSNVVITVSGIKSGAMVIRRVVTARFERGITNRVEVVLTRDCVAVMCGPGVDCQAGRCTTVTPPTDAGVDAGGLDAGPPPDAGPPVDAGPLPDGGMGMDAGRTDGGVVGTDAGPDAGMDVDAFVPPVDAGGVTPVCTNPSNPCAGVLVISELATEGTGGGSDEFVEIYNRGSVAVDASGLVVGYSSSDSGSPVTRSTLQAGAIIPPGSYFLTANNSYSGGAVDGTNRWSTGFNADRGTVFLVAGSNVIDRFAWSDGSPVQPETAAFPNAAQTGGGSYERKANASSDATSMASGGADATAGNGHDTNNNLNDFVLRSAREPQTATSPAEP